MKQYLFILFCLLSAGILFAQSNAGITGIHDTSYNINSDYRKTIKSYPFIKIVEEIQSASVASIKNIIYCKTGIRKLKLDVFYPKQKSKDKNASIIFIHGGGWRSGDRSLHYPLAQQLAQLGYVCFTPEYRLSTEALYPAAVYDIKSAIRWVRKNAKKFNLDTSKIVIAGHSAGGELAAFMGATNRNPEFEGTDCNLNNSSVVNAVIDIDGALTFIHPESGEGDDSKRTSAATFWFGYSKTENPGVWMQASPLTHVGKQCPPVLFLNSSVARMHAGREDFIKIMNKYNIYSEVRSFDNAPHTFCFYDPWFQPMLNYMDAFLKKAFQ
jgi:pectinesterase